MRFILLWLILIIPSSLWGVLCAHKIKTKFTGFIAAAVPWLALLLAILYTEYYLSNESRDASMWSIAQLIGGTVAAGFGYFGYKYSLLYLRNL